MDVSLDINVTTHVQNVQLVPGVPTRNRQASIGVDTVHLTAQENRVILDIKAQLISLTA